MSYRRNRTKFTGEQLKVLIDMFNHKPYPNYTTRQKLALEINVEEPRIQIWFQNRRARHPFQKRLKSKDALESNQDHGQDDPEERSQARRHRTHYNDSQLNTLMEAFENNPYPGIDSREQLAKEIGVPESRVHIWFQNQRCRVLAQMKKESDEAVEEQDQKQES